VPITLPLSIVILTVNHLLDVMVVAKCLARVYVFGDEEGGWGCVCEQHLGLQGRTWGAREAPGVPSLSTARQGEALVTSRGLFHPF